MRKKTAKSTNKKNIADEQRLSKPKLFQDDAISILRIFEAQLKEQKIPAKKTDKEIVKLITGIHRKNSRAN